MIFHAFTDKTLKRFAVIVNDDQVDQLIDYLDHNNIKCYWRNTHISASPQCLISKSELKKYLVQSVFSSHSSVRLYFYRDDDAANDLTFYVDIVDRMSGGCMHIYRARDIVKEQSYVKDNEKHCTKDMNISSTMYTVDNIPSESFDEEDMIEIIVTKFSFKHDLIDKFFSKIINIKSWYNIFNELKECSIIDHRSILRTYKGDENRAYLLIEEQGNRYLTNIIVERK